MLENDVRCLFSVKDLLFFPPLRQKWWWGQHLQTGPRLGEGGRGREGSQAAQETPDNPDYAAAEGIQGIIW